MKKKRIFMFHFFGILKKKRSMNKEKILPVIKVRFVKVLTNI